jgi:hypothetical protein
VGYFFTDNARAITLELKRRQFVEEVLPEVFASMELLGLESADFTRMLREHKYSEMSGNKAHESR